MKFAYTMLSILVTLFLVSGCSDEKPETYKSKNIVRKAIQKPVKKKDDWEETKKDIADIVTKDIDQRIAQETVKEEPVPVEDSNKYITREGDTLSGISAKADIYNNPLKWPFLYRDNSGALSSIKDKKDFINEALPAGMELKIVPEEEVQKNLENRAGHYYVANIISSPYMKEIAPQVVKLTDAGYFVYITSTMIKDREWYRIRAGFYKTRSEANEEGDMIKDDLKIPDIWTVKIGDEEFHDFAGY